MSLCCGLNAAFCCLTQAGSTDVSQSEGEFLYQGAAMPDLGAVLGVVSGLQAPDPILQYPLNPYPQQEVAGPGVDKSLGEVSEGQRPQVDPDAEGAILTQQPAGTQQDGGGVSMPGGGVSMPGGGVSMPGGGARGRALSAGISSCITLVHILK